MQLLVSAASAADARAALEGGADIVDAKDPAAGALGAVSADVLRAIADVLGGDRPLSAALGDAGAEADVERAARGAALAGASYVKFGFAGLRDARRVTRLLAAAALGAGDDAGVVAVAYADAERVGALAPLALIECAANAGAHGVLLDTARKEEPPLLRLLARDELERWVGAGRDASLLVALAGRLALHDLPELRDLGADIVGVRGAACVGGRSGHVSATRVRALRHALDAAPEVPASSAASSATR